MVVDEHREAHDNPVDFYSRFVTSVRTYQGSIGPFCTVYISLHLFLRYCVCIIPIFYHNR